MPICAVLEGLNRATVLREGCRVDGVRRGDFVVEKEPQKMQVGKKQESTIAKQETPGDESRLRALERG